MAGIQMSSKEWRPPIAYAWGTTSGLALEAGCGETLGRPINTIRQPSTRAQHPLQ